MRLRPRLHQTIALLLCGTVVSQANPTTTYSKLYNPTKQAFGSQALVNRAIFSVRQTLISTKRAHVLALLTIQPDLIKNMRMGEETHKILAHPITFYGLIGFVFYYFVVQPQIRRIYLKKEDTDVASRLSALLKGATLLERIKSNVNPRKHILHIRLQNESAIYIVPLANPDGPSNYDTYHIQYEGSKLGDPPIMTIHENPDYRLASTVLRNFVLTQTIQKTFQEEILVAIETMLPELFTHLPDVQSRLETAHSLNSLEDYFNFSRFFLETISLQDVHTSLSVQDRHTARQLAYILSAFIDRHDRAASEVIVNENDSQNAYQQIRLLLSAMHKQYIYPALSITPLQLELIERPHKKTFVLIGKLKTWRWNAEKTTLTIVPQNEGRTFLIIEAKGSHAQTIYDHLKQTYPAQCHVSQNIENIQRLSEKPTWSMSDTHQEFSAFLESPEKHLNNLPRIQQLIEEQVIQPHQAYWAVKILNAPIALGRTVTEEEIANWAEHWNRRHPKNPKEHFELIQSVIRRKNHTLNETVSTYLLLLGFFSDTTDVWHDMLPVMHPYFEQIFKRQASYHLTAPLKILELGTLQTYRFLREFPDIFKLILQSLSRSPQAILTLDYVGIPKTLRALWQFDVKGTLATKKTMSDELAGFFSGEVQLGDGAPPTPVIFKVSRNPPLEGLHWDEWLARFHDEIEIAQLFSDLPQSEDSNGRHIRGLKYYGTVDLGGTTNPAYAREPWVETKPLEQLSEEEVRLWLTDERVQQLIQLGRTIDQKQLPNGKPLHISNLRIFFATTPTEHHQPGDIILFPPSQLDDIATQKESHEQQINRRTQQMLLQSTSVSPAPLTAA